MSLTREQIEELVDAIRELNGNLLNPGPHTPEEANRILYDVTWAALCHNSSRAARFYQPDGSPESRIYNLMFKAFSEVER